MGSEIFTPSKDVEKAIREITAQINEIKRTVMQKPTGETVKDYLGKAGDIKIEEEADGTAVLKIKTKKGWSKISSNPTGRWYNGDGTPAGSMGRDGDYYLDTTAQNVYIKQGGQWA